MPAPTEGGGHYAAGDMDIARLEHRTPFITKDGSEIRELAGLPTGNAVNQSLAHATVAPRCATDAHYHPVAEEIYLFVVGRRPDAAGRRGVPRRRRRLRRHPARHGAPARQRRRERAARPLLLLLARVPARGHRDHAPRRSSGLTAGPCSTAPSTPNRDPWHGQSHERSAGVEGDLAVEVRAHGRDGVHDAVVVAKGRDLLAVVAHDAALARRELVERAGVGRREPVAEEVRADADRLLEQRRAPRRRA